MHAHTRTHAHTHLPQLLASENLCGGPGKHSTSMEKLHCETLDSEADLEPMSAGPGLTGLSDPCSPDPPQP
jgi:hypothetical protein